MDTQSGTGAAKLASIMERIRVCEKALAAAKGRVAHGFSKLGAAGRRGLARGKQLAEPLFHCPGRALEFREEGHLGQNE